MFLENDCNKGKSKSTGKPTLFTRFLRPCVSLVCRRINMRFGVLALAAVFAGCVLAPVVEGQRGGEYKVLSTNKVGGEGGFDYVYSDSVGRRLYVPRLGPAGAIAVYDL